MKKEVKVESFRSGICYQKGRLLVGGVFMKGKRKLSLIVAAAMAAGIMAYGGISSAFAETTQPDPIKLYTTDNKSCTAMNVAISKQYLPSTGLTVVPPYIGGSYNDSIAQKITGLTGTDVLKMTFDLKNATFSGSGYSIILDNDSDMTNGYVNCIGMQKLSDTELSVSFDNTSDEGQTITNWYLVDSSVCANYSSTSDYSNGIHVTMKVDGDLKVGDRVELDLTSEINSGSGFKTFVNGCFKDQIYVIENQWLAHTCKCCKGDENGIDKDLIVVDDQGYTTVMDTVTGKMGVSIYNACEKSKSSGGGECCPEENNTCTLFCNKTTTGGTYTEAECSMPGYCTPNTLECVVTADHGLGIYTQKDFMNPNTYNYQVTNLNNSKVTFTLTGNELDKVEHAYLIDSDTGNTIAEFNIDNNTTATVTVDGSTLFVKANGGTQAGGDAIEFKVKIVPKQKVLLDPTTFSLTATISGGQVKNSETVRWVDFEKWGYSQTGSFVFKVPYIRSDNRMSSVIRFENAGTSPVKVSLFVDDPNGSGWQFVKVVTVNPGTSAYVLGRDLIAAAQSKGITLDGTKGFAVKGVSDADENYFTVYASQQYKGTTDFRPLPVKVMNASYKQ